jgi:hypothetical protein
MIAHPLTRESLLIRSDEEARARPSTGHTPSPEVQMVSGPDDNSGDRPAVLAALILPSILRLLVFLPHGAPPVQTDVVVFGVGLTLPVGLVTARVDMDEAAANVEADAA